MCKALLDRNLMRFLNTPFRWHIMNELMRIILWRKTMKLLLGARDRGPQSLLVMISLCTSWMILPLLFQKHMHHRMLTTGKMRFVARWILSWLTEHGKSLIVPMVANLWDVNGCSKKRSLGLMALLKNTRLGSWLRVIPRRKENISSILRHMWPD